MGYSSLSSFPLNLNVDPSNKGKSIYVVLLEEEKKKEKNSINREANKQWCYEMIKDIVLIGLNDYI